MSRKHNHDVGDECDGCLDEIVDLRARLSTVACRLKEALELLKLHNKGAAFIVSFQAAVDDAQKAAKP